MRWSVRETQIGMRLDRFLAEATTLGLSRSVAAKLIDQGKVRLDGRPGARSAQLRPGQVVELVGQVPNQAQELHPQPMPLDILYEDDFLLVVNKPAGLVVHPGAGTTGVTLVHGLLAYTRLAKAHLRAEDDPRPGIVHRLDRNTTGVMVVAKTDGAYAQLQAQFQRREASREYVALLEGRLPQAMTTVEGWLGRDPRQRTRRRAYPADALPEDGWRYARTIFREHSLLKFGASLVVAKLATGRTHQIRAHAASLGLPVVGDVEYGSRPSGPMRAAQRQMLHARVLRLRHPDSKSWMVWEAPLPEDFRGLVATLKL